MLVAGAIERMRHEGSGELAPRVMALVNSVAPSLHRAPAAAVEACAPLRRAVHELMTLNGEGGELQLLYAMPSLTRAGSAVVPTPPPLLTKLRAAYFAVLERARRGDG